jgi:hypothetical protein
MQTGWMSVWKQAWPLPLQEPQVGSFYSDHPLNAHNWSTSLEKHTVLVSTAQCLVNVVQARGAAALSDLDLLVGCRRVLMWMNHT